MPLYMDRHYVQGATKAAVADAHEKDLAIQEKYPVRFYTYWFDEPHSTAFCLIEAPDRDTIQKAHNEAHGLVPNEIIEVDSRVVEAFLGRVKDPTPEESSSEVPIDSAFRAIMFTDLKDSTLMTTMFGDTKALHLLHVHNALIRNALREHHGHEVKNTGDGIMASFAHVEDAVNSAIAVQKAFADHNQRNAEENMHVRIGLAAGEPVEEDGDFFGSTVHLAARICARVEPDHIMVAQVIRDECQSHEVDFINLGEITPKGFTTPICVYEVNWQQGIRLHT